MQEHIRRAHPEHYISKLPATEESFHLMINTPPSERPQTQQSSGPSPHQNKAYLHDHVYHRDTSNIVLPHFTWLLNVCNFLYFLCLKLTQNITLHTVRLKLIPICIIW